MSTSDEITQQSLSKRCCNNSLSIIFPCFKSSSFGKNLNSDTQSTDDASSCFYSCSGPENHHEEFESEYEDVLSQNSNQDGCTAIIPTVQLKNMIQGVQGHVMGFMKYSISSLQYATNNCTPPPSPSPITSPSSTMAYALQRVVSLPATLFSPNTKQPLSLEMPHMGPAIAPAPDNSPLELPRINSLPIATTIPRGPTLHHAGNIEDEDEQSSIVNFTGEFKLVHSQNYEEFLRAQGLSWAMSKAAMAAKPTHTYTHTGNNFRVQIYAPGFRGDTTFIINGPAVETSINHYEFRDYATYTETGDGIVVRKIRVTDSSSSSSKHHNDGKAPKEVYVIRHLLENGDLRMRSIVVKDDPQAKKSEAIQTFHRIN